MDQKAKNKVSGIASDEIYIMRRADGLAPMLLGFYSN